MAQVDELDVDESTLVGNRAQQLFFEVYRGTFDATELPELRQRVEVLDDRDLHSGLDDLEAARAVAEGRYADAVVASMHVADVSDLNAPYALPRAGRAAILAGGCRRRPTGPRPARRDRRARARHRRRPDDHPRRVGGARRGSRGGSPGLRSGLAAFRDLGLPWDEALAGGGGVVAGIP